MEISESNSHYMAGYIIAFCNGTKHTSVFSINLMNGDDDDNDDDDVGPK